jgi:hypothetical protein
VAAAEAELDEARANHAAAFRQLAEDYEAHLGGVRRGREGAAQGVEEAHQRELREAKQKVRAVFCFESGYALFFYSFPPSTDSLLLSPCFYCLLSTSYHLLCTG